MKHITEIYTMSVWHPANIGNDRERWETRFWLPVYDAAAIVLGGIALVVGSPIMNRLFPEWWIDLIAYGLGAMAMLALFGVIFPRLWFWELIGRSGFAFIIGAYAGIVSANAKPAEPNGFVVLILYMAVWLLGPRVTVLMIRYSRVPPWWVRIHRRYIVRRDYARMG